MEGDGAPGARKRPALCAAGTALFAWLERVLWIGGAAATVWALGTVVHAHLYQSSENRILDRELLKLSKRGAGKGETAARANTGQLVARREIPRSSEDAILEQPFPEISTRVAGEGGAASLASVSLLFGRLEIPRLHLRTIVREGVDPSTLRLAAGHIPGTALPEASGNVGIAGHRDSFFRELAHVRKNDGIRLTTLNGIFLYRVDEISVVEPSATQVLAPTTSPSLTLVTCYPFRYIGAAPKRFVVRAHRIAG